MEQIGMRISTLFRYAALAILVQIALGGLVTFNFIPALLHIIMGSVVLVLAVVTVAVVLRSKTQHTQLRQVCLGLLSALVVQIALGLATMSSGSNVLAWIHLILGVLIYAMALTGQYFAREWEQKKYNTAV
jgi:heme A synthase